MELVGVVLGCSNWFDEAERLMDGCFNTYTNVRVLGPGQSAGQVAVQDGKRESTQLCVMEELVVPLREGEAAQIILDVPETVSAPVYPGMHMGTAHLTVGGQTYKSVELVASERVDSRHLTLDVRRVVARWVL